MLRFLDQNNVDITDERQYCNYPSCPGEPWCSAWNTCSEVNPLAAREPQLQAMEQEGDIGSGLEFDDIISELLDYSPTPLSEPQSNSSLPEPHSNSEILSPVASTCESSSNPKQHAVSSRFAEPKTNSEVLEAQKNAVPKKTRQDTEYCIRVFESWRTNRNSSGSSVASLEEIDKQSLSYWLARFVLEARKVDGTEYPPNTLHHIVCGIMRHMRSTTMPGVDFYSDSEFAHLKCSLDAEMKRLQSMGLGSSHKQAEPLTNEDEEQLWEKKILGGHNPQSLLKTMVFMNGLYFALRSGDEHRNLRHSPCQIQIVQKNDERPYLLYTEDISKNHPGGIKGRKVKPKVVKHYANTENPDRCFVRLFEKYRSLCPSNAPAGAFYLTPLKKPKSNCWYTTVPIGRNKLSKAVADMCKEGGIMGYKTNHSLRATAATRLYESGIDEQLVMERTGHRSIEGVRSYKRTTNKQTEAVSDILSKRQCREVAISEPTRNKDNVCSLPESTVTSNTMAISLPSYTSKSGAFYFSSCTNVNINFNSYSSKE